MKNIWTLTRLAFLEAIRRRVVLTGLILGICFLLIFSIGFHYIYVDLRQNMAESNGAFTVVQLHEAINFLLLSGMYAASFLSAAMGALLCADTLAGEINSGIIQTIVSKPIRRLDVVLGKWLGFAAMLGLYSLLVAGGTAFSVWLQSGYTPPHLPVGLPLIYLEALLVMTLSLTFSSRMSALASGGAVFGLYGLAFIGGWVEQLGALVQNQTAVKIGIITSLIIPSEALWRRAAFEMQTPLASAFVSPFGTVSVPSIWMIAYAVLYVAAALTISIKIFGERDL